MDRIIINGKTYYGDAYYTYGFMKVEYSDELPNPNEEFSAIELILDNGRSFHFDWYNLYSINGNEYIYNAIEDEEPSGMWMKYSEEYSWSQADDIETLKAQNQMLTEVLLEMSEILYA